jgi:large subunit ribosomal protein L2
MGKKIRVQRRGRGSSTFRAPTFRHLAPSRYVTTETLQGKVLQATVQELVHQSGRGVPLAKVRLETGDSFHTVAAEGLSEGQHLEIGPSAHMGIGNILPLGQIPPGTLVCNLELRPNDGGKIARASGAYATVVAHTVEGTAVKLPSGRNLNLNNRCRATIGVVSGAGRTDKPFLKAGKKRALMKARGRTFPTTKGVAMNAAFHPHGGGAHKSASMKPTTVARTAPAGQKVGLIAARQTGRKKRGAK